MLSSVRSSGGSGADQFRTSDPTNGNLNQRPAQEIIEHLERERSRRRNLMVIGIPAQLTFFGVGLAYADDSKYILIELIPLVLLLRLFFLPTLHVAPRADVGLSAFSIAVAAFRGLRRILNGATTDRVRVLRRARYRHVQWPISVLIFEQNWKRTRDQFFLIIGPEFHWWSGGSIWSPRPWGVRKNSELEFSKSTPGGSKQAYCIKLRFSTREEDWLLKFKTESDREEAYQALRAIRELCRTRGKNSQKMGTAGEKKPNTNNNDNRSTENSGPGPAGEAASPSRLQGIVAKRLWHEVLGVAPAASPDEIKVAYKSAIKKCHPDTVANHSERIKQAAVEEATQINVAYAEAQSARGF